MIVQGCQQLCVYTTEEKKSGLLWHVNPSPEYPLLQVQENEPWSSIHTASVSQGLGVAHSLMSMYIRRSLNMNNDVFETYFDK